ncbi:MAG: glycosyltransferase family 2 protein [Cypionkella sp.]
MNKEAGSVPEAFRLYEPRNQLIAAGLAQSLSNRAELSVEVTFDMEAQDPATYLYVDLVNAAGDRRAHLSIRIRDQRIVLNTMENGVWKEGVSAKVNFEILRYWRLWMVVDPSGSFSVRLGNVMLCEYAAELIPGDVAKISSNVSARCVLGMSGVINGPSGMLDRDAPMGSTALIYAPQVPETEPVALKLSIGDVAIDIFETTTLTIAGQRWFACLLDDKPIQQHARSDYVRVVAPDGEFRIFDVLAHPIVEISPADIVLRSMGRMPAEDVLWRCPLTSDQTAVRLVTATLDVDGAGFVRFVTPMSEVLRLVPLSEERTLAVLDRTGLPQNLYELAIGSHIYAPLEAFVRATVGSGIPISAEGRMVFLDWWSVLHLPDHKAHLAEVAPFLSSFMDEQRQFAGVAMQIEEPAAPVQEDEPSSELISLWRGLRSVSAMFADPTVGVEAIRRQVLTLAGLLRVGERHFFILEVSGPLLTAGLGDVINSEMSDGFIAEMISHESSNWQLSSALAPLAARNRFTECASIMERLAKIQGGTFNFGAVSATVIAASAAKLSATLRHRIAYSFLEFLKSLGSREYTSFRHAGLMQALIRLSLAAADDPDWYQSDLLSFIEQHYSTVPEFWTAFETVRRDAPSGLFLDRFVNLAATASQTNSSLAKFRAFDGAVAPEQSCVRVVASGERQDHLSTFLRMHGLSGVASWGSAASAALCEDHFLRSYAHPFMEEVQTQLGDLPQLPIRDAIMRLQNFPLVEHRSLLETVGRAVFAGDFERVCSLIPMRVEAGPTSDPSTNAIIIDAITWVLLTKKRDEPMLSAVILQIIDRVRNESDPLRVPPGLHAAVSRLLHAVRKGGLDALTVKQIANLEQIYVERFPHLQFSGQDKAAPSESFFSDTLIALVTCRKYLDTRARECRETWVKDVEAAGATVLFFCGSDDIHEEARLDPETNVVYLPVGDSYEDLPSKSLEIFRWIKRNRPECFVLKIDDDCYLDAQTFLSSLSYRRSHYFGRPLSAFSTTFDRTWHQAKSARAGNKRAIDTSPLGSRYADGGGSYSLSRFALGTLDRVASTSMGLRLRMASFFEDKMVGDLLREGGVEVSNVGYTSLQARRTHSDAVPVLQIDRTFFPNALSGIAVAHLDTMGLMASIQEGRDVLRLGPPRVWPMNIKPSLSFDSNMLEALNPDGARAKIEAAEFVCVCSVRNEKTILPHFLQHYRSLGVDLFLMVDNMSDDGTREYLRGQDDVVLFSAANEYKTSHYAVDWQRVVLDHFCAGRWVVVADADEFLLTPQHKRGALKAHCRSLEAAGHDAALVLMADMYPNGALDEADFSVLAPGQAACAYDAVPVQRWSLNRGPFGNLGSYVSGLRHRLMPLSPPERFTAQKFALFKFNPLMSFSEGFHFGTGMQLAPQPLAFLHYKYSAEFAAKARLESQRQQHFGGGVEYRAYLNLVDQGLTSLWRDGISETLDLTEKGALTKLLHGVEAPFAPGDIR